MFVRRIGSYLLRLGRRIAFPLVCLWLITALVIPPGTASAQPTGYQEYYVLGYEEHVWQALLEINDADPDPADILAGKICSTVSLVATADHQVVYYDHWEDGYEIDLMHPTQPTTLIYGDENPSNGGPENDRLRAGDSLNLTSDQDITGSSVITGYVSVASGRDPADIRFDGGDRIITSGGPVDLAHAIWPLNNSWIGGAWEMYSRQAYADTFSYRIPVGGDLYTLGGGDSGIYGDFRDVYLQLVAFEDNTIISIQNGIDTVNLTLDRGQSYSSMGYIDSDSGPSITINSGTSVRSSKPIQVGLVTGADGTFQGRFFILLPEQQMGTDYVVPVPSGNAGAEAEVYISNPNNYPIEIMASDRDVETSFTIPPTESPNSTVPYSVQRGGAYVPADSAARFTSPDGPFNVVVCANTSESPHDWGFAGIPSMYLTRDYYVSWSPGNYFCPGAPECALYENGSPVWVTPVANDTTFYVDFHTEPDGLDGVVDEMFVLNAMQQRRIFDPDNDNTGMHIWATGDFAVAWGEDPRTAGSSEPYLDLGISVLPLQHRWLDQVLTIDKVADPASLPPSGGTVTFTLMAESHKAPLINVSITDTLPVNWSYVPGSTQVRYPLGATAQPDPVINGQDLFWDLDATLDVHQVLTLTFQAQITDTGGADYTAYDSFESNSYSGGANWNGPWQETGDDGSPAAGQVRISALDSPYAGTYHLQIAAANSAVFREVDLSGFVQPTLSFMRRVSSMETAEYFHLDIHDGIGWTTVMTWTEYSQEGEYVPEILDLTPFVGVSTSIRFRGGIGVDGQADFLHIDQVKVFDRIATSVNNSEAVGEYDYYDVIFNPSAHATVSINPLSLIKTVSASQSQISNTLVYTISYANLSTGNSIPSAVLRDVVPVQHVSLESFSAGGSYDPASGTIVWPLGTLAPLSSGYVTLTVQVKTAVEDGTLIGNEAYVDSDATVIAYSNPVHTLIQAPQVEFNKSGPAAAHPGEIITYTIQYQNTGGVEAREVMISDTIPASTTYVPGSLAVMTSTAWVTLTDAVDGDPGAYISPTLTFAPNILPADSTGMIRFSVQVHPGTPIGSSIHNWAWLDRRLDTTRESNLVVTVVSDLLIRKQAHPQIIVPGDVISYSLTCDNTSSVTAQSDVYIQDEIPEYTSLITGTVYGGEQVEYSWDGGVTWSPTPAVTPTTDIRWHYAQVPASTQEMVGFAVQVDPVLPWNTPIDNTAYVTSSEVAAVFSDWVPSDQVIVDTIDIWIAKSVSQASVPRGELLSYAIVYGNRGTSTAFDVSIEDTVPIGTVYSPGSIFGIGADDSGAPHLTWNLDIPADGAARQVGYTVVVSDSLAHGSIITNVASISSTYGLKASNQVSTLVIATADLSISKLDDPDPANQGSVLTYTINYSNDGPSDAANVTITDSLPISVTFGGVVSVVPPLYGPTATAQSLWWYTPTVEAGTGGTIVLTVTVDAEPGAVLTNDASIGSTSIDPQPDNNSADTTTAVEHYLVSTKVSTDLTGPPLYPGDEIEYRAALTNTHTSQTQTNASIDDALPAGISFVPGSLTCSPLATCAAAGGYVSATIPLLGPGDTLTMTFRALVDSTSAGITITNYISPTTDQYPGLPQPPPTIDVVTTSWPALAFTKWVTPQVALSSDTWTKYSFQITNTGDVLLTSVRVWDNQLSPKIGYLIFPDLDIGESYTLERWWPVGVDVHNVATATAGSPGFPGLIYGTAEAYYDLVQGISLTLQIWPQPDRILSTQTVTYTYRVINIGSDFVEGGVITDVLYGPVTSGFAIAPGDDYVHVTAHTVTTTTINVGYARGANRLGTSVVVSASSLVEFGPLETYLPLIMRTY